MPPPDLYARYGLPTSISDQAAFARQVANVVAFWRELKNRRMYTRLADTLIAAHAELEKAGRLRCGASPSGTPMPAGNNSTG